MNNTKDTIIVTGGAGFIGSNLISSLNSIGCTKHSFIRLLRQW